MMKVPSGGRYYFHIPFDVGDYFIFIKQPTCIYQLLKQCENTCDFWIRVVSSPDTIHRKNQLGKLHACDLEQKCKLIPKLKGVLLDA